MLKEFKEFAMKGNIVDLAIGVVIGGAFQSIVNSLVQDIIMPAISIITGKVDFSDMVLTIGSSNIKYGNFITTIVNFLIIAFSIFLVVRYINKLNKIKELGDIAAEKLEKLDKTGNIRKHRKDKKKKEEQEEQEKKAKTETKICPYCCSEIKYEATRCPHCTSVLEKAEEQETKEVIKIEEQKAEEQKEEINKEEAKKENKDKDEKNN